MIRNRLNLFFRICLSQPFIFVITWQITLVSCSNNKTDFFHEITVISIDNETEKQIGDFPFSRLQFAKMINQIKDTGIKGLAFKFFFDIHRDKTGDSLFAENMQLVPVYLQMNITSKSDLKTSLESGYLDMPDSLSSLLKIKGETGWVPLPKFQAHAQGMGFIDAFHKEEIIPIFGKCQGKVVLSFYFTLIEIINEEKFLLNNNKLIFSEREIPHQNFNFKLKDFKRPGFKKLKFQDILRGNFSDEDLKGKLVIVAYFGDKIHMIKTNYGPISAHELFIYQLYTLNECMKEIVLNN